MSRRAITKRSLILVVFLLMISSFACTLSGEVNVGDTGSEETEPAQTEEAPEATHTMPPTWTPEPTATETPTEPPTEEPAATEEPTEEPTDAPTEEATEEPTAPPEIPPDVNDPMEMAAQSIPELQTLTLDPSGGGLGHLGTFRQQLSFNITGEAGTSATYIYEADVNTSQQAMHITLIAEGEFASALPSNQVQFIWIGNRVWVKVGNQPWVPVPENVAAAQFDEQAIAAGDFLPYVPTFNRVGEETLNGVATAHYTYSAESLATEYGTMSGSGDIYVAKNGGYVVRYTFNGSGDFENYYSGTGDIQVVYDTYDVGADINIKRPR